MVTNLDTEDIKINVRGSGTISKINKTRGTGTFLVYGACIPVGESGLRDKMKVAT